MKDSKLIRLLKTFSKDEWKEFEKFAASPYFNKGRNYNSFIKELKKFYPEFDSGKLTKEYVYKKIYAGKLFKENVISTMASGLYNLALDFLIHNDLKRDDSKKFPVLIKEMSLKGLKSEVEIMIKKINSYYAQKKIGHIDYFDKYNVYEEIYDHYFINDERIKLHNAIEKSNLYLVRFFLHMMIQSENQLLTMRNFTKRDYRHGTLGKIIKLINFNKTIIELDKENSDDTVVLKIYYYFLLAAMHPETDKYYSKVKSIFEKYYDNMDTDLKNRCYVNLLGICAEKIIEGKSGWNSEALRLYKRILEERLYYYTGGQLKKMPRRFFRNVITIGINNNEIEWTKNFIENYIDETELKYKDILYNFGMAKVEFAERNFEKALIHSNSIAHDQLIYKIEIKNLQSKIYYETDSRDPFYSITDTYMHMLDNSGITNVALVRRHKNFIKYIQKLFKIKDNPLEDYSISKLDSSVKTNQYVTNKPWLLEKIAELEKKSNRRGFFLTKIRP